VAPIFQIIPPWMSSFPLSKIICKLKAKSTAFKDLSCTSTMDQTNSCSRMDMAFKKGLNHTVSIITRGLICLKFEVEEFFSENQKHLKIGYAFPRWIQKVAAPEWISGFRFEVFSGGKSQRIFEFRNSHGRNCIHLWLNNSRVH
jgi:hypothetical protein